MTPKAQLLEKLLGLAYHYRANSRLSISHPYRADQATLDRNAKDVGKIVLTLPSEDREILKTFTTDDFVYRPGFHGSYEGNVWNGHIKQSKRSRVYKLNVLKEKKEVR